MSLSLVKVPLLLIGYVVDALFRPYSVALQATSGDSERAPQVVHALSDEEQDELVLVFATLLRIALEALQQLGYDVTATDILSIDRDEVLDTSLARMSQRRGDLPEWVERYCRQFGRSVIPRVILDTARGIQSNQPIAQIGFSDRTYELARDALDTLFLVILPSETVRDPDLLANLKAVLAAWEVESRPEPYQRLTRYALDALERAKAAQQADQSGPPILFRTASTEPQPSSTSDASPVESGDLDPRSLTGVLTLERASGFVELLGKLGLAVAAVAYGTGLAVVNLYLSRYGAYSINPFRTTYIAAGIWALVPVGLTSTLLLIVIVILVSAFNPLHRRSPVAWLVLGGMPVCLLVALVVFAAGTLHVSLNQRGWMLSWLTAFMVSMLLFSLAAKFSHFTNPQVLTVLPSLGLTVFLLAFFFLHTVGFAHDVYGTIPAYAGGGQPQLVRLAIEADDDLARVLVAGGIVFRPATASLDESSIVGARSDESALPTAVVRPDVVNSNSVPAVALGSHSDLTIRETEPVGLVFVTDTDYIVMVGSRVVSLPRESIKSVFFDYVGGHP